jgi:hypothetical protein
LITEALDTVKDLCVKSLPSVTRQTGEWVDVSERLPELKQRILVSYETMDDGKKVDVTTYDKYGFLIGKAQAWMPLPKPYQKGGK